MCRKAARAVKRPTVPWQAVTLHARAIFLYAYHSVSYFVCVYVWGRSNSGREGRGCLLHAEAHRQNAQAALKLGDLDCDAVHDERGRGIQQFQGAATCCGVCATGGGGTEYPAQRIHRWIALGAIPGYCAAAFSPVRRTMLHFVPWMLHRLRPP